MYYFRRQALISVGAIAVAIFISKWDYHLMIPFAGTLYLISVVLMAMVRFTPFGVEAYGSRRWLKLGIQFQPAEIAKNSDYYLYAYTCYQDGKTGKAIEGSNLAADLWYDTGGCGFCFYG